MTDIRKRFRRTKCDCRQCTLCCEHMPGNLAPGDLEVLAGDEDPEGWALKHLEASEGALAMNRETGQTYRIGTLVPRSRADGSCIFLQDGQCQIHEHAPFGCAFFDAHMDAAEAHQRSLAVTQATAQAHLDGDLYAEIWQMLQLVGQVARPLESRRESLQLAIKRVERRKRRR